MSSDALFGWDLTYKSVEQDIKKKEDVLIAFIHFVLLRRNFRCIGIGDDRTLSGNEDKSELLPTAWNDSDNYTIRYVLDDKLYILSGTIADGNLIVNLVRNFDLAVTNMTINVEQTVEATKGKIGEMIPNYNEVIFNIKRDLVDSITNKPVTSSQTQTQTTMMYEVRNPSTETFINQEPEVGGRPFQDTYPVPPGLLQDPRHMFDPRRIGSRDLDPFAPGGGGMLFDPFSPQPGPMNPGFGIPGGLPHGAVPPGARFDPFGPGPLSGGIPQRPRPPPDSDHLPPPGFDDMFM